MNETTTQTVGTIAETKLRAWGIISFIFASGLTLFETVRAARGWNTRSVLLMTGIFVLTMLLRVLFLKLSARILGTKNVTWSGALAVVGANGVFTTLFAFIAALFSTGNLYISGVLLLAGVIFAFFSARKVFRTSLIETLALYALSFAIMLVIFAGVIFIFHVSIGEALGGVK